MLKCVFITEIQRCLVHHESKSYILFSVLKRTNFFCHILIHVVTVMEKCGATWGVTTVTVTLIVFAINLPTTDQIIQITILLHRSNFAACYSMQKMALG